MVISQHERHKGSNVSGSATTMITTITKPHKAGEGVKQDEGKCGGEEGGRGVRTKEKNGGEID